MGAEPLLPHSPGFASDNKNLAYIYISFINHFCDSSKGGMRDGASSIGVCKCNGGISAL